MLIDGKTTGIPYVEWGNDDTVCMFCEEEYVKENKVSLSEARKALRKTFVGQKVVRIRKSFDPIYICHKHLEKLTKDTGRG